jgi:antitoxin MazE
MRAKIQKWGNSLALRIPKPLADEICLGRNSSVEVMLKEGFLVVVPVDEQKWTLEQLLAGVTEENIHHEWAPEPAIGEELW